MELIPGPAYRIETPNLVLRCWRPHDAPLLKAAVDASLDHLRPWMPWAAKEPTGLQVTIDLLRAWRGKFDLGEDFGYGIFNRDETEVLGGAGLHTRVGPQAREIGYWVHQAYTRRGYATETAAALTRAGFEIERLDRIEIHIDPRNTRSAAIPPKLGYTHEATLRRLPGGDGEPRDMMVWTLFAGQYPGSPASRVPVRAFDCAGREIRAAEG